MDDSMDKFINEQNLVRFKKLLSTARSGEERRTLLTLLAEEEDKFVKLQRLE